MIREASLCMILAWILPTVAASNIGRGGAFVADGKLAEVEDDEEDDEEDEEAVEVEE